nr:hypothetical protein [Moorena producens]
MQRGLGGFPHERLHQDKEIRISLLSSEPKILLKPKSVLGLMNLMVLAVY